ncbi:MAG: hypothetical protein K0V04_05515 [Deltaproteobacteria bacterium]|nr:hypothetical protein [Deltaproteobacteria bacterium]
MNARHPTRFVLPAVLLGSVLAAACFDDSALENQDCASGADCSNGQDCVVTDYQASRGMGFGWCRPKGDGCAAGIQPGCGCTLDGLSQCCSSEEVDILPFVDGGSCICVFDDDTQMMGAENTEGSGCFNPGS